MKCSLALLSTLVIILSSGSFSNKNEKNKSKTTPVDKPALDIPPTTVTPKKEPKKIERKEPSAAISYRIVGGKKWSNKHIEDSGLLHLIASINRTDIEHLSTRNILLPNDSSANIAYYMPLPLTVTALEEINKIIFFSYPTQSFGAYENGQLVHTGATNMGRKKDPTPKGLFFTNWKAEETTSTFNDEWILQWNFNVESKLGIGWHQYEMPGYPASHSCMRLQEQDAKYLYYWAEQWVMNKDSITFRGTPVIVFGKYKFGKRKPWLQLSKNAHAIDISEKQIEEEGKPYLSINLEEQQKKETGIAKNQ